MKEKIENMKLASDATECLCTGRPRMSLKGRADLPSQVYIMGFGCKALRSTTYISPGFAISR